MPLIRLVYYSEIQLNVEHGPIIEQLTAILDSSIRNNKSDNITGALVFDNFWFIQVLEGERSVVFRTFDRIRRDERHKKIVPVQISDIDERIFGHWWMGLATRNEATLPAFARHEVGGALQLDQLSGTQISALVVEVAKLHSDQAALRFVA